jgi:hypothetical protein
LERLSSLDGFSDEPSEGYGTPADHQAREKARAALEPLDGVLNAPRKIGIGHNRPPEGNEPEEIKNVRLAIPALKLELAKANPAIGVVKRWARPLRDALIASTKWAAKKIDKGVDAAMKVLGAAFATWLLSEFVPAVHNAIGAVIEWLEISVLRAIFQKGAFFAHRLPHLRIRQKYQQRSIYKAIRNETTASSPGGLA